MFHLRIPEVKPMTTARPPTTPVENNARYVKLTIMVQKEGEKVAALSLSAP